MNSPRDTGTQGEEIAANFLLSQGYQIITTNYTERCGEIDIVADDQGILAMVEVKYYQKHSLRSLYEAIDQTKQKKLIKTAQKYLFKNRIENKYVRFDAVLIESDQNNQVAKIDLLKDAFRP